MLNPSDNVSNYSGSSKPSREPGGAGNVAIPNLDIQREISRQTNNTSPRVRPARSLRRQVSSKKSYLQDTLILPSLQAYSRVFIRCPCAFIVVYAICIGVVILAGWKPIEVEMSFDAFVRADGAAMRNREAYTMALENRKGLEASRRVRRLQAQGGQDAVVNDVYTKMEIVLYYEAKDGGPALTDRVLREMRLLEMRLRALPEWQTLCNDVVTMDHVRWLCDPGETIASFVWPTTHTNQSFEDERFELVFNAEGPEIFPLPVVLLHMQDAYAQGEKSRDARRYFPSKNVVDDDGFARELTVTRDGSILIDRPMSLRTRFQFFLTFAELGDGVSARRDNLKTLEERYRGFIEEEVYPTLIDTIEELEHTTVYYSGDFILEHEISRTLIRDILWALGSIGFVTFYMWCYIRSFIVSLGCFFIIFASVPVAYVLTPMAQTTLASFLSLFLVTVIDIDVIFVFVDFWDQSEFLGSEDLRLAWMTLHAGKSCLATSLTTSMGFFSNLASALQPLREFGMFMGLSVIAVYVFAVLLLPPLILLRERRVAASRARANAAVAAKNAPLSGVVPSAPAAALQIALPDNSAEKVTTLVAPPSPSGSDGAGADHQNEFPIYIVLMALVDRVSRCPALVVAIAAVCFPVFMTGIITNIELDMSVPEIFSTDHNQVAGKKLAEDFDSVDSLDDQYAPPVQGNVCRVGGGSTSDTKCIYHWCDKGPSPSPTTNDTDGSCWRGPTMLVTGGTTRQHLGFDLSVCDQVSVFAHVSSSTIPSHEAWSNVWRSAVFNATQSAQLSTTGFALSQIERLFLEDWELGDVKTSLFFESTTVHAFPPFGNMVPGVILGRCEIEAVCFFGPVGPCELPEWRSLGQYNLNEPSGGLGRSLKAHPLDTHALQLKAPAFERRALQGTDIVAEQQDFLSVVVVWGLRAPKSTPLVGPLDELWSFDPTFEPDNPWAQRAILAMCRDPAENIFVMTVECWIEDFRSWLLNKQRRFPSRDFSTDLLEWYQETTDQFQSTIWLENQKMSACRATFYNNFSRSPSVDAALTYQEKWDDYVASRNAQASVTANKAWHTTSVWVTAEAQSAIIESTASTIAIECGLGWFGILLFTGDPALSLLVLTLVIINISGLTFFMVVIMDWALGPIEIIFLVVFLGYSVTFGLHMSHNYAEAHPDDPQLLEAENRARCQQHARLKALGKISQDDPVEVVTNGGGMTPKQLCQARTRMAVLHVGGAILASSVSTIGSSMFLLVCTLTLFTKLGYVVITVTSLSIVFTLVALPAVLMVFGPPPEPWHVRLLKRKFQQTVSAVTLWNNRRKGLTEPETDAAMLE